ncbi:helix-turn-helix domain-containing protein [Dawidia cretensis]|uniref:helix-turn-helix domain-containing protein n=1 Tax=Dawidia cretensis TaxID=2782350 RepID=UPI0020B3C49A|nr:helix-turn-helix domain-containing protein [Dawidia cretensis]
MGEQRLEQNTPLLNRDQLLTVGDLEAFKQQLFEELQNLLRERRTNENKQWLRSADVRKMLSISAGTLQNLRITGVLSFVKVRGIMLYKHEDIIALLESGSQTK